MTTTHSVNLSEHEVRAALAGTLGLVVRPVAHKLAMCFDTPRGPEDVAAGYPMVEDEYGDAHKAVELCPFGVPGTRLVCKETWRAGAWREPGFNVQSRFAIDYKASPEQAKTPWIEVLNSAESERIRGKIYWELNAKGYAPPYVWEPGKGPLSWRSPATMPAWASRITLEVKGVRCVRCTGITYEDAEKSGVADALLGTRGMSPLTVLRDTWTTKYGTRYPWETSWAWAVEVRRVEG